MTNRKIERIAATDVQDGDIIFTYGYRCRASGCHDSTAGDGQKVRTFILTSEPDALNGQRLTGGFNGGRYGGNARATYGREVVPHTVEG
jgi:hypothetical protein